MKPVVYLSPTYLPATTMHVLFTNSLYCVVSRILFCMLPVLDAALVLHVNRGMDSVMHPVCIENAYMYRYRLPSPDVHYVLPQ